MARFPPKIALAAGWIHVETGLVPVSVMAGDVSRPRRRAERGAVADGVVSPIVMMISYCNVE